MFPPVRGNGRALFTSLRPPARLNTTIAIQQRRWKSFNDRSRVVPISQHYEVTTPLAEKLKETGVFGTQARRRAMIKKERESKVEKAKAKEKKTEPELPKEPEKKKRGRPKKKPVEQPEGNIEEKPKEKVEEKATGDRTRVNIVDEKLVDDIISYLKPSLERHKGCDLISIYPGAGLFTKALHDAVEPRSHLLLEPDEDLYRPFLEPILNEEGSQLIPKSGIVWQDLAEILTPEYLPNQKEFDRKNLKEEAPLNDTLLVNMNLCMHPKRKYMLFDSMSRMVVYQLLSSLRTSTLFQKYGRVRMLIWIPDDEKGGVLPRTVQQRKKQAIEGELITEYIGEVCGADSTLDDEGEGSKSRSIRLRPKQLELESIRQTLIRMKKEGFVTPKGRETRMMRLFSESGLPLDKPVPLTEEKAIFEKSFHKELATLRAQYDSGAFDTKSPLYQRFKVLRAYSNWLEKRAIKLLEFTRAYDNVVEAYNQAFRAKANGSKRADKLMEKAKELNETYNRDCDALPDYMLAQVTLMQDQLHSLRQPEHLGPLMSWDRRPYEPLPVKATEFYPNMPCSLIDIQPKAMHPMLRAIGPGTNNAGDIFDMILGVILLSVREPIDKMLDQVWPGTAEGIIPLCTKLKDPAEGGSAVFGHGAISARAANVPQLLEVLEQFIDWPFKPTYAELVGRLADEKLIDEASILSDGDGGASHMGNNTMDAF
ncbi:Mitochondrial transcription factor 1 [Cytospora mali]|uniref:rRNA adenine N(6)-methyltransferase n=1 Tax=Cytospora mali TaxID=578113 RepID=A0A194VP31_CYTMA|nr:Mitochondrial transcription factor 1 [Valsa mali]